MKYLTMLDKKMYRYYCVLSQNQLVSCDNCGKPLEIDSTVIIYKQYDRHLSFKKTIYCDLKCYEKKQSNIYEQEEVIVAKAVSSIKENCVVIDDEPTIMKHGKMDLYQACALESDHTTDKTVHSNDTKLVGFKVGDKKYLKQKEDPQLMLKLKRTESDES